MMKLQNIITIVITCMLSAQAIADIHLTTPNQLKIKIVNGQNAANDNPLILKNGTNQIAFSYEDRYREAGEDIFFESDIIVITFAGSNQDYFISLPTLKSKKARESFNDKPQITLSNKSGEEIAFEQSKLLKNGLQFNRDLVSEIAVYNQTIKPASLKQSASLIIPTDNQSESDVAAKMLDYWYNKADKKTQEEFKKRINN